MRKSDRTSVVSALLSLLLAALVPAGCKTAAPPVPVRNPVDPLDLLDGKSAFFLRIPAAEDRELVARVLRNYVRDLPEEYASDVAERIDVIYAGLSRSRHSSEIQLAASCAVPKAAVAAVFSQKNGWNAELFIPDTAPDKFAGYRIYDNGSMRISFPSDDIVCLGRGVAQMVGKYDLLSAPASDAPSAKSGAGGGSDSAGSGGDSGAAGRSAADSAAARETGTSPMSGGTSALQGDGAADLPELETAAYEWLSGNSPGIRFFASRPQSFLTMLTGANLNFKLVYVRGVMTGDPRDERQYRLELEFEFRDRRLLPAAKGVLSVAFGLTGSDVTAESDTHLRISNIRINKEQLYKILVL